MAVRNQPPHGTLHATSALSDRQRAAVALAALGYGNKQIAYALGLSPASVGMLLLRARVTTGVASRAELIRRFKLELQTA